MELNSMGKNTQKAKRTMGGKGTHYDALVVGVIVLVAILIVLFVYTDTIAGMIDGVKTAFLGLFGL